MIAEAISGRKLYKITKRETKQEHTPLSPPPPHHRLPNDKPGKPKYTAGPGHEIRLESQQNVIQRSGRIKKSSVMQVGTAYAYLVTPGFQCHGTQGSGWEEIQGGQR